MTEALSICHNCGKHFCAECLSEGDEYYYCKSPECQHALKLELKLELTPGEVICPACKAVVQLNNDERNKHLFRCPECETLINLSPEGPEIIKDQDYIEVISSMNQADVSILHSMLDGAEIDYYIAGENFLGVDPLIAPARVFVASDQVDKANELLKDFSVHIFGVSYKKPEDEN
jgi:transcription initiation factor IIE alpha subunit